MIPEYLSYDRLLLLCGHYEGIDQRVLDLFIDEELSVGDFLSGRGVIKVLHPREDLL